MRGKNRVGLHSGGRDLYLLALSEADFGGLQSTGEIHHAFRQRFKVHIWENASYSPTTAIGDPWASLEAQQWCPVKVLSTCPEWCGLQSSLPISCPIVLCPCKTRNDEKETSFEWKNCLENDKRRKINMFFLSINLFSIISLQILASFWECLG